VSGVALRPLERLRPIEFRHLAVAGAFFLSAMIGLLAGVSPKLAIAAALGLAFVLVALGNLAFGVSAFAVISYLELAPVAGGPALSFTKLAGLTLMISWLATITAEGGGAKPLFFSAKPKLTIAIIFFAFWMTISATWAEVPANTWGSVLRYALNLAIFPIVFTAIREPKHMRWVTGAFVVGAALAAAYGLSQAPSNSAAAVSSTAAGDLDRATGTVGDPNLLASVLVVGIVMAGAVALDSVRSAAARLCSCGAMVLCMAALIATASRGGVVALSAALIASVIFAGPRYRAAAAVIATSIAVILIGFFAFVASQAQVDRITTADGGSGRTDIWKVGWRMFEANPVHGVGEGNFQATSIHYVLAKPGAIDRVTFFVDEPTVAHNLYLEILAEIGVVGLAGFLAIVVLSIASAANGARRFDRLEEPGLSMIARAVIVGLAGTLAADFFLSAQLSKQLWILLALGPAMQYVAIRMEGRRSPAGAQSGNAAISPVASRS